MYFYNLYRSFCFVQTNRSAPQMKGDIITITNVAEYLKIKKQTVYALIAKGDIPGLKVGGSWRFDKTDIDSWIKKHK